MTAAPRAEKLGYELHDLVAALEPARWRDEARGKLRNAFEDARQAVEDARRDWSDEPALEEPRSQLADISRLLTEHLPAESDGRERWMEFREQLHPAYEELAAALRACHVELPSLRPTNYARSGFHVLAAVIGLLLVQYAPWALVIAVPVGLASLFWFLEIARRVSDRWNRALMKFFAPIAHPHERFRVNSSTWFATALSLLALTFEPVVAGSAIMVLGVGDPAAALVGRKFGRVELVNSRTLEGTLTFVAVSFLVVLAVLYLWHGELSLGRKMAVAGAGAMAGALTELFCRRIDDNFAIPVVAGAFVWAVVAV
ncbi:MAG: diacylglycerol/polyprenol kinase family protein [Persicimonas sp.]